VLMKRNGKEETLIEDYAPSPFLEKIEKKA
jgi:hypothetical protein